jgi:hypothetical protein
MAGVCAFRPKTGGRRDWLYPIAHPGRQLRRPPGSAARHLTLRLTEGRNKNEVGEVKCVAGGIPDVWRALPQDAKAMDMTTLLIIVIIVILLGGGGFYGRGRWW